MDAVVFFGWLFTEAYTEIYSPRWTKWFIAFALGVDSVSLFVNPFYRHVFNVHRTEIAGNTFYTADHFALLLPQDRFSEEAYNTASGRIRIADDLSYKITVLFGVYKIDPSDSASIPVMCDRCLFAIQASEQNDPRVVRYFDVNMRLDAVWSQQM